MNKEVLRSEIQQIESRHESPVTACAEIFQFLRGILAQIDGPVDPEFKRALRAELDRAHHRAR